MTDSDHPRRRFQFSLKSLLVYSVLSALAISLMVRLASAGPLAAGLVVVWLMVTAPFVFFAEIVDWLLGAKNRKDP